MCLELHGLRLKEDEFPQKYLGACMPRWTGQCQMPKEQPRASTLAAVSSCSVRAQAAPFCQEDTLMALSVPYQEIKGFEMSFPVLPFYLVILLN